MKIETRIYIDRSKENPNLRATANVTLDGSFVIKGIQIMQGNHNSLYIKMPYRVLNGVEKEECFPVTNECRDQLHISIMTAYHNRLDRMQKQVIRHMESYGQPKEISDKLKRLKQNVTESPMQIMAEGTM